MLGWGLKSCPLTFRHWLPPLGTTYPRPPSPPANLPGGSMLSFLAPPRPPALSARRMLRSSNLKLAAGPRHGLGIGVEAWLWCSGIMTCCMEGCGPDRGLELVPRWLSNGLYCPHSMGYPSVDLTHSGGSLHLWGRLWCAFVSLNDLGNNFGLAWLVCHMTVLEQSGCKGLTPGMNQRRGHFDISRLQSSGVQSVRSMQFAADMPG